eukprot:3361813-Amphidinium_carterae.1
MNQFKYVCVHAFMLCGAWRVSYSTQNTCLEELVTQHSVTKLMRSVFQKSAIVCKALPTARGRVPWSPLGGVASHYVGAARSVYTKEPQMLCM